MERTRAPRLGMFKLPLARSDPAEIVGNRGADALERQRQPEVPAALLPLLI